MWQDLPFMTINLLWRCVSFRVEKKQGWPMNTIKLTINGWCFAMVKIPKLWSSNSIFLYPKVCLIWSKFNTHSVAFLLIIFPENISEIWKIIKMRRKNKNKLRKRVNMLLFLKVCSVSIKNWSAWVSKAKDVFTV